MTPTLARWRWLQRYPRVAAAGGVLLSLALVALLAPILARWDPVLPHPTDALAGPSLAHLLGTDELGRDTLSRVIWGARVSLSAGLGAVSIGLVFGVLGGLFAGYVGGWVDLVLMRCVDALLAFPALLLALAITAALGPDLRNAMIAIGLVQIPVYARLARGQVLQVRELDYIQAARAIGVAPVRMLLRHFLPNIANALIVQASLSSAFAILAQASLSFLGLGTRPPTPDWGQMMRIAYGYLQNDVWMAIGPGVAILLTVFSLNLLGDSIRDALDPHSHRR